MLQMQVLKHVIIPAGVVEFIGSDVKLCYGWLLQLSTVVKLPGHCSGACSLEQAPRARDVRDPHDDDRPAHSYSPFPLGFGILISGHSRTTGAVQEPRESRLRSGGSAVAACTINR